MHEELLLIIIKFTNWDCNGHINELCQYIREKD